MKYIRTENKIIKLDFDFYDKKTKEFVKIHKKERFEECVFEGEYKSANTIEELCDEFVLLSFDDKPTIIEERWGWSSRLNHAKKLKEETETREKDVGGWADVFGAIWTDKGLIYVAKMNNKGELELL